MARPASTPTTVRGPTCIRKHHCGVCLFQFCDRGFGEAFQRRKNPENLSFVEQTMAKKSNEKGSAPAKEKKAVYEREGVDSLSREPALPAAKEESKKEEKQQKETVQEKVAPSPSSGLFSEANKERFARTTPAKPVEKVEKKVKPQPVNRHAFDDFTVYVGNLPSAFRPCS